MIVPAEIAAGITAAWRLARRDPDALAWIDATPRGFGHSFFAAAIVLPAVLLLEVLDGTFAMDGREPLRTLAVELIAYVMQWTAFPLAMSSIADGLGRGGNYIRYIVVYNWSAVLQMALFVPVAAMAALFPGDGIMLATVMATDLPGLYRPCGAGRSRPHGGRPGPAGHVAGRRGPDGGRAGRRMITGRGVRPISPASPAALPA